MGVSWARDRLYFVVITAIVDSRPGWRDNTTAGYAQGYSGIKAVDGGSLLPPDCDKYAAIGYHWCE